MLDKDPSLKQMRLKCSQREYVLPVNEMQTRNNGENKEPEPEEDINFVIDHVNWQNTQSIKP